MDQKMKNFRKIFTSILIFIFLIPFQRAEPQPGFNVTKNPPVLIRGGEKRVVIRPRQNIELSCPVTCDPPCIFHWTKKNESVLQQWDRFIFLTLTKSQLQIRAVRAEDSGTYECLGVNGFGSIAAQLRLIVEGDDDPAETNLIKRTPSDGIPAQILIEPLPLEGVVTLGKGQVMTLHCEATGYPTPTVTWFKNSLYLLDGESVAVVQVSSVGDEDAGVYRCDAENELGRSKYEVRVQIQGSHDTDSPVTRNVATGTVLSLTPTNLTLMTGQTGQLTCVVRVDNAFTKPVLLWFKLISSPAEAETVFEHQGQFYEIVVDRPEVIQKSDNTYMATLIFKNVTRSRAGTYYCVLAWPTASGDYDLMAAQLQVPIDTAKLEKTRQKVSQVQWTLLWTFGFLILSILTVLCFSRLYGSHRARSKARSQGIGPPGRIRPTLTPQSPDETISTTLTHQNEVCQPFLSPRRNLPEPVPNPNRKRTYRQHRLGEPESDSGLRRHARKTRAYFISLQSTTGRKQSHPGIHRLHRIVTEKTG